jgi:hypothetical protein
VLAESAHNLALDRETQVAGLAADFVSPEQVLAARVYGLTPAHAVHAVRLASRGPSALQSMAGAIELTFLRALGRDPAMSDTRGAGPADEADAAMQWKPSASSMPRGSFLWPATSVRALGLEASAGDDSRLTIAALELLAAGSVAELATYATAGEERRAGDAAATTDGAPAMSRRDSERFAAVYLALSQSGPTSAAAQAARAMAVASRGEHSEGLSARQRAQLAWAVLPMVHGPTAPGGDGHGEAQDLRAVGTAATLERVSAAPALEHVIGETRPGLQALAGRAGEALSSYVAAAGEPAMAMARPAPVTRSEGAIARAPSAAPELVKTARSGKFGGGEVEIPSWFEAAARKMLDDRSGGDGISLAELTLVTAAPATQLAAASRAPIGNAPVMPATHSRPHEPGKPNIEEVAREAYSKFLEMMDVARWRNNGEP